MCRESNNSTIEASNKNDMNKKNDTEITGTVGNGNSKNESGSEIKNNDNKLIKNLLGRKIHNLNENLDENELNEIVDITYEHCLISENKNISKPMLWNLKLSHASKPYLTSIAKLFPRTLSIVEINNDNSISEFEACLMSKCCKLPFKQKRNRAERPLQILHADTMGPVAL